MSVSVSARTGDVLPLARKAGLAASVIGHAVSPAGCTDTPKPAGRGAQSTSCPVLIDGSFGWLHSPVAATRDTAVLLCPALGWDGLHAYHGFRLLADQFAAAGYPALRMQYPGTGDSRDLAGSEESWAAWQQSVEAAADWLRAETGATRLILAGLRIGGTLATLAAQSRDDVDGLVLLAPVFRGKSYVRQLDMEARLEGGEVADGQRSAEGLEFHEVRFSADTVALLSKVDLRQARLRAGTKVAVALQAPSQMAERCAEAWTTAGLHVASLPFTGLEPLLQNATHSDPAVPDFSWLFAWVTSAAPAGSMHQPPGTPRPQQTLCGPGYTETPVRFGKTGQLFGILCRPAAGPGQLAVIIANTGRDPHYGIGRFGVEFARQLASDGVSSLRMDFAGLGDSPSGEGDALTALFETERTADLSAAIDSLQAMGYRDFAVQGLCSGAYHAFLAAKRERRIGALLLVNLPTFQWQGGDSVKAALWKAAPASRILERLVDLAAWQRVLQGQAGLGAILRAQAGRLWDRIRRTLKLPTVPQASPEQTMAALESRGVRTLFLYSAGDPGIDTLEDAWGRGGEQLGRREGVDLRIVSEINHVLSGGHMRKRVVDHLVSFLRENRPDRGSAYRSAHNDDSFDHSSSNDNGRRFAASNLGPARG